MPPPALPIRIRNLIGSRYRQRPSVGTESNQTALVGPRITGLRDYGYRTLPVNMTLSLGRLFKPPDCPPLPVQLS
jgi:hypothetical protein